MAKRGENIYKRKDGRFEGRYIKGHHLDGRPVFGYIYAYTYSEVKQALTLAKAASQSDKPLRIIGKGTLAEFLSYWLNTKEHLKPSTHSQYYERMKLHILPALGHEAVSRLTKAQVQDFTEKLRHKGLSPSSVANIYGLLRSAMKKALELRLTGVNPCDGVTLPKPEHKERRVLDRAEQSRLEKLASHTRGSEELAVFLALYAGLRIGEICALRWRDIDLPSGTIMVRATLQRITCIDGGPRKTMVHEGDPKSRRALRRIPMPPGLTEKLSRLGAGQSGDAYVLTGKAKPMEPRILRARFARLAEKAGLPIPFHALRHTFSTRCLEHNFDVQTLSELLGHADASTTLRVYAHSVFEHKRRLADRIFILSEINEPSNKPSAM